MNLVQATSDPKLFAPWFKDEATWTAWRAFLGALFGLPLSEVEAKVYRACTARQPRGIIVATTELGREIYVSSNGDRWHLLFDSETGHSFVRHSGNLASGGHVTDIGLPAFLADGRGGAEHQALWRMIASLAGEVPEPVVTAA